MKVMVKVIDVDTIIRLQKYKSKIHIQNDDDDQRVSFKLTFDEK